jgi:DNA invertase Pin-like site-specific DNA recombinase
MSKITTEHLARSAYVYIRQSTADQLTHNHESRRRQYGLTDRARQLGWTTVEVIDDDLGRSGGGTVRPGFERLLAAICEARVGAVLAIEASRLARNGRDWHTLIEFCGLVGTLIVDEDGIYDPRHPNDRLLLGMKGTMSELELSLFRQRSQEALKQKASRGALILGVAAGYVKVWRDRIEKNPDQRAREALQLVFSKFAKFQSVRQVHIWLRDEGIELPVKSRDGEARGIVWRLPAYNIVHNILTNPIYAGAYAFGRTTSKVSVEHGRKRVRRGVHRPMTEWDVLIKDHHAGYITWEEFERNQGVIANNATGKGSAAVKGAVRRGELLLPGLLRCGHCGRKLHVSYSGKLGRYSCYGARTNHGTARCISISGLSIDSAVGAEVLRVLKPLGIEAAVKAIETRTGRASAAQRQLDLSLQQARYEAAHARRQYDAVDPANRLVAADDGARRDFRPCKCQKNLKDGKGQFAIEVVFGNPEPALALGQVAGRDHRRPPLGSRRATWPGAALPHRPPSGDRITGCGDKKIDTAGTGIAADVCARRVILDLDAQQTRNLQTTEILQ